MHSATEAYLKKQNLIATVQPSNDVAFGTYQGKRVIVDDGCPVASGVYTTYLFGNGAVALGNGNPRLLHRGSDQVDQHSEADSPACKAAGENKFQGRLMHQSLSGPSGTQGRAVPNLNLFREGERWQKYYWK